MLRYGGSLWLLQAVAGALIHLAFDWIALALALTALYLGLAAAAAVDLGRAYARPGGARRLLTPLAVAVWWQLPALPGSINLLREQLGWTAYDGVSDLLDFAMQTWNTALMPALALLPARSGIAAAYGTELAGYYVGLAAAPPLLVAGFVTLSARAGRGEGRLRQGAPGEPTLDRPSA